MKHIRAFTTGTIIAAVSLFPLMLVAAGAVFAALAQEADNRGAQQLMRQLRPGITECTHPEARSMNCIEVKRGKRRTVVLAAAKE